MATSGIRVTPFSSALGALVTGIDLGRPLSDSQFSVLRQAFSDHEVLFFRDQDLTPEQHLDFARRWAPIDVNRFFKAVQGHPEIAEAPDHGAGLPGVRRGAVGTGAAPSHERAPRGARSCGCRRRSWRPPS